MCGGVCVYLRTGWTSLLRGTGKPPAAGPLGRGRALRGGARERVGVVVTEPGLDTTFMGWRRARGDGAAGVRNLLLGGTEEQRIAGREVLSNEEINYTI